MSNYLTYICVKTCNQRHDKHNGVYVNKLEKMMMTDPTIVHLLSVLCGTIAMFETDNSGTRIMSRDRPWFCRRSRLSNGLKSKLVKRRKAVGWPPA